MKVLVQILISTKEVWRVVDVCLQSSVKVGRGSVIFLQLNQFSQMCGEVVNGLVFAVKVFTALQYYNTL